MRHCNYAMLTGIIRVPPIGSCSDRSVSVKLTLSQNMNPDDLKPTSQCRASASQNLPKLSQRAFLNYA